MVKEKEWDEFRQSGLLWFINTTLHVFGWAIVCEMNNDGKVSRAYPAKVKFRGFDENTNTKGYESVERYMREEFMGNNLNHKKESDEC